MKIYHPHKKENGFIMKQLETVKKISKRIQILTHIYYFGVFFEI